MTNSAILAFLMLGYWTDIGHMRSWQAWAAAAAVGAVMLVVLVTAATTGLAHRRALERVAE